MKTITITCKNCGTKCEKPLNEINRQKRNGRTNFYCSLSCSAVDNNTVCVKIVSNCLWCKNKFETTTHKKARKCCSLDCAKRYSQSKIDYSKIYYSKIDYSNNRGNHSKRSRIIHMENRQCIICPKKFNIPVWKTRKTCSDNCHKQLSIQLATKNPNCGGETNYKKFKYNDIWMDSTWEVEIAKLLDSKGIEWERSRKKHMLWWTDDSGKKRRYYPDFFLPKYNVYLDPKNKYKSKIDKVKIERVIKENNVTLIWGLLSDVKEKIEKLNIEVEL